MSARNPFEPRWRSVFDLRFGDFDYLGHMTATAYLMFFEEARVAWLSTGLRQQEPTYVVAHQEIDFERELLRSDSPVTVEIAVMSAGNSHIDLHERLISAKGLRHATSRASLVMWDREQRRPRPCSEAEKALFADGSGSPNTRNMFP
ncbi:acyl-CoA thioesterase [Rhodococcus sp. O3]|uniref:acyl-CoA thioesterase n=1 Tax=Rhodococcus sp. O3 TaxID=3404919 RepID=UPI003B67B06E